MKRVRGILVDVRKGIAPTKIDYTDYKDIAKVLKCKWITCVPRMLGGRLVDVYCDEEALLRHVEEPAILTRNKTTHQIVEVLLGNCFICRHNKKGEIISLKRDDYDPILLTQASVTNSTRTYQVLQAYM